MNRSNACSKQLVDRAEVVVDEAVVLPCLGGQLPGRDSGRPVPDQQPLGGIEERLDVGLPDREPTVFRLHIRTCQFLSHMT